MIRAFWLWPRLLGLGREGRHAEFSFVPIRHLWCQTRDPHESCASSPISSEYLVLASANLEAPPNWSKCFIAAAWIRSAGASALSRLRYHWALQMSLQLYLRLVSNKMIDNLYLYDTCWGYGGKARWTSSCALQRFYKWKNRQICFGGHFLNLISHGTVLQQQKIEALEWQYQMRIPLTMSRHLTGKENVSFRQTLDICHTGNDALSWDTANSIAHEFVWFKTREDHHNEYLYNHCKILAGDSPILWVSPAL